MASPAVHGAPRLTSTTERLGNALFACERAVGRVPPLPRPGLEALAEFAPESVAAGAARHHGRRFGSSWWNRRGGLMMPWITARRVVFALGVVAGALLVAGREGTVTLPTPPLPSPRVSTNDLAAPSPVVRQAPVVPTLSGAWRMTSRVEATSVSDFVGLRLGYQLWLEHDGHRIQGHGFKWTENGSVIAPAGRTPISVEGSVTGTRLELGFSESGARRASRGTLTLDIVDERLLHGRFSSDAARSSGDVTIVRGL